MRNGLQQFQKEDHLLQWFRLKAGRSSFARELVCGEPHADRRFPLIAVVPVTGTAGDGALYPALTPGPSGLAKASCALVDHLRSTDKRRIRRIFGQVSSTELASIDQGLELFLGLGVGR